MFLDASVIVAVLGREPGWESIFDRLRAAETDEMFISPLVRFEAVMALARKKAAIPHGQERKPSPDLVRQAREAVDAFIAAFDASEVAISAEIGTLALEAGMRYRKAVGHPASLNFGDCFAYACARSLGVQLAYKGDDFARTDLA